MKILLKEFKHKGEKYGIMLEKRPGGMFILKDFNGDVPFSPFFYCVGDWGFIDIDHGNTSFDQPVLNHLIAQSEQSARYWADNKHIILGYISN